MKRPVWAWLALSSIAIAPALAATRPHYGGNLAIELSSTWTSPDPQSWNTALSIPIAETLVRANARGGFDPVLCVAWQHDADFKRWRFSLRPKVTFHDGAPLTGATAAPSLLAALKKKYPDVSIQAGGQAIVIQSGEAMPGLLDELAAPATAIFRTSDANPLIGTGPFRITAWETGRRLALAAFDDYWGSRPFLDAVTIELGATRSRADIFDIPPGPARRILPEGIVTWSSEPRTLVAITAATVQPAMLQALALAIDRAPIVNVLAQHRADPAFSVLPQWLSGYAFLFQSAPDVARARQIVAPLHAGPLSLSYPANDPFLRSIAERIALNAKDAGMAIQPTPNAGGNLRLLQWTVGTDDADLVAEAALKPEAAYALERARLDDHRIIPLLFLRETYGIAPRVHIESSKADPLTLHLEDVWVQP